MEIVKDLGGGDGVLSCQTLLLAICTVHHYIYHPYAHGIVALSVECRTCDQEVVGPSLGQALGVKTLGKFLTQCLCHQAV